MRFTIATLLLPVLAGCASQMPSQSKLAEAQANYNNQDDNLCRSYGATVGTDPYFECRRALAQQHVDAAAQEAQRQTAASPPTTQQPYQQPLQR
jgi:hypothetical protein